MQLLTLALFLFLSFTASAKDFTTYIGDAFAYRATALATDAGGNTYVTGGRLIPASGTVATTFDVFVTKLDPSGNLVFTRTFSGKGSDQAKAIAVDAAGNIVIGGSTTSNDFPVTNALQKSAGSGSTGFLLKLAPDGSTIFSTYFGGTAGASSINGIATDARGDIYVAGRTTSSDYPHTPGLPAGAAQSQSPGTIHAAFFTKLSAAGDRVIYGGAVSATQHTCGFGSACILSTVTTSGDAIGVDASGNAYLAGNTDGVDLNGTAGALLNRGIGPFVMKINAAGDGVGYLTFLATGSRVIIFATSLSTVTSLAVDATGRTYLTGSTADPEFLNAPPGLPACPATAGAVNTPRGLFVASLDAKGSSGTLLDRECGPTPRTGSAIALDSRGRLMVAGTAESNEFSRPFGSDLLLQLSQVPGGAAATGQVSPVILEGARDFLSASIAFDSAGTLHTAGGTGLVSTFTGAIFSVDRVYGVTNVAGGQLAGRVAPGEIVSLFAKGYPVAYEIASFDSAGFLPVTLSGLQITINSRPAPLLFVSSVQVNFVVPLGTPLGESTLRVFLNGTIVNEFRIFVDAALPQVFRNAQNSAIAINEDGTFNSPDHPAKRGSYVSIFVSGAGAVSGVDGQRETAARPGPAIRISSDSPITISYSGSAPGTVTGLTQVNFQIPLPGASPLFTNVYSVRVDTPNGERGSEVFSVYVQ